tara:strand:- start:31 stop:309 length:279 start_codon:yes stop_codon:yes gene_type:complete
MSIKGSLIKGVIHLKDNLTPTINHIEAQENVLSSLLNSAKDTEFGKVYNFEEILSSEDKAEAFAKNIPYFDYNKLKSEWWNRVIEGEENTFS